ncbi:hypothetical protein Psed_6755 (plasmid) [Pseudonocardia dioxanivorans CB1190]|uniref:Uncharacterized protein n=1 Tax=Pseudonocardia dioxanivorans (strain ATCC 55486 / DSM 44775 / JCM 13855 / CB1190) TaxID=675635 RepID=F2L6W4_PSEUX|nr:hypothetical protein Psed_6755 [Pseudonocardia dioxanivorans CB1190]
MQHLFTGPAAGAPIAPLHEGARCVASDGAELWMPSAVAPALIPRPDFDRPDLNRPEQPSREHSRRSLRRGPWRAATTLPIPLVAPATPGADGSPPPPDPGGAEAAGLVGELEGAAFAGRFVAEFLSWDEDDPTRRAQVLRTLLRDPRGATLGWSGAGRQRVEVVLPGRTLRTECGGLIVEVTARVLSFQRTCPRPHTITPPTDTDPAVMSCCPPPSGAGWAPGESSWTRLAPPVVRLPSGELKIDLGLRPPQRPAHPHGSRGTQR